MLCSVYLKLSESTIYFDIAKHSTVDTVRIESLEVVELIEKSLMIPWRVFCYTAMKLNFVNVLQFQMTIARRSTIFFDVTMPLVMTYVVCIVEFFLAL